MAENENASPDAQAGAGAGTDAGEQVSAPAAVAAPQQQPEAGAATQAEAHPEDITYHAVEKDGQVTAIWEMHGRKHLRTIDPRSRQGQEILRLYTAEHGEDHGQEAGAGGAATA